ncbi:MAG: murein L,D-transpeptidase catalytic domain family protein, partial [Rudanella sp.]|nr:murein L,D-transpeptidase catalytic domain family protein [Rudanella sp.]
MKRALIGFLSLLSFTSIGHENKATAKSNTKTATANTATTYAAVFDDLNLETRGLNRTVFDHALRGMQKMMDAKPVLSIVDMSQPSSKKRLYVIDLVGRKLLFNTYVAHGRNSGVLLAEKFSNTNSSFQSSLGFYQTLGTYQGKHGLSLQLKGLERGINDNAFARAIVMHGANYVCEDIIRNTGRLGRSQGCPAVSNAESKPIIQAIKGGSCLFIYSPDPT